jgi:hypothetical protein
MNIVMTNDLFKCGGKKPPLQSQFCQIGRRKKCLGMRIRDMRHFTILAMMAALFAPPLVLPVYAAEAAANTPKPSQNGPLKPGRSAGVRDAQLPRTGLALIGASAIIAVVVVAAGSGGGNANNQQPNLQSMPTTTVP